MEKKANRKTFIDLLHRAIMPEQEEGGKEERKKRGGYTGKQTRSRTSANASKKQRGGSR